MTLPIEEKIKDRIKSLIKDPDHLSVGNEYGQARTENHASNCKGWLAAAANVVQLVCGNSPSAYKDQFNKILEYNYGLGIPSAVGDGKAVLESLLQDIEYGLLASIADTTRAETFDNFLDHAKAYHKEGAKNEAGVIAGVVFEDSIRRVCDKHTIPQAGKKLDELISQLAKVGVISQTKAKRARVSAHVRTKATHAQWDEYDLDDVAVTIKFTEELIENHIDR